VFDSDDELEDPADFRARGLRWADCCGAVSKMKASGSSFEDYMHLTEGDVFIAQDLEQIKLVCSPTPRQPSAVHSSSPPKSFSPTDEQYHKWLSRPVTTFVVP